MGTEEEGCKILQLSDCTLICVLSCLDATSLFNLSRTCLRFKTLVEEQKLWKFIDARREPNSTKKVQYVCERVHDRTSHLLLKAESKYEGIIPQDYLLSFNRLENIKVLALENQRFDGRLIDLNNFPKSLEELSLRKSTVKHGKLFFHGSYHTMRRLRVLIVDECDWVDSNFFMSIAKYDNLEILSIVKCQRLHFNVIPYLSVAKHGCKNLKLVDSRFSTISNEIIRTFESHRPIIALYFQSMRSYELDKGTPLLKNRMRHLSSADNDLLLQTVIKSQCLEAYGHAISDHVEELPESLLYEDPYPECTCGFKDSKGIPRRSPLSPETDLTMSVDDYIDFQCSPQRFICRRHVEELNKLPSDFKNFFYQNQKKFYPDSSDNDSDSDDDSDCCMFGVGKSHQMIVLKVREVDEQGNIPEPEVINISQYGGRQPGRNVINIDVNVNHNRSEPSRIEPQPTTSRGRNRDAEGSTKRKAEEGSTRHNQKVARIGEVGSSNSTEDNSLPGTSRDASNDGNMRQLNDNNSSGGSNMGESSSRLRSTVDNRDDPQPGPSQDGTVSSSDNNSRNNSAFAHLPHAVRRVYRIPDQSDQSPRRRDRMPHENLRREPLLRINFFPRIEPPVKKIKLRRLSLRGYRKVTDHILFSIQHLNLDLLDVTHTSCTTEALERYLEVYPNCRIVHRDFCVCKPRIPC